MQTNRCFRKRRRFSESFYKKISKLLNMSRLEQEGKISKNTDIKTDNILEYGLNILLISLNLILEKMFWR